MIDETQKIILHWNKVIKKYYIEKGYEFTDYKKPFEVKINDLPLNANIDVIAICDYCKNEIKVKYKYYNEAIQKYNNYYCPHCVQKWTLSERQEKMYNIILEFTKEHNYQLITKKEELESNKSEVKYICPKHGEYTTKVCSIKAGKICYKCSREKALRKRWDNSLQERQDKLYEKILSICTKENYKLLSTKDEITSYNSYITYQCPKHGDNIIKIANLFSGKRCYQCAKEKSAEKYKLDSNEVALRISQCGGTLLNKNDYKNQTAKNLKIICPKCGEVFITSLRNFTQHKGQVCSNCYRKESVGELKIRKFLEEQNIDYVQEKWFSDCRDINPLPFDFYLPKYNICIEFDGEQHFKDNHYFNFSFNRNKEHDEIKNKYCNDKHIKLIRIPYLKLESIQSILHNQLHEDIV